MIHVKGNFKINFEFINTVTDKLRICYTQNSSCNPDNYPNKIIEKSSVNKFIDINENGLWSIYISEYSNNNKVGETRKYYVVIDNTSHRYLMSGNFYNNMTDANNNEVAGKQRIYFNITDNNIDKLKICFTKDSSCDPLNKPDKMITKNTVSNYIDMIDSGLWKIYVSEFKNDVKVGENQVYYVKIK